MPDEPDLHTLATRMRAMTEQLSSARTELEGFEATGYGGNGLVTATVSHEGRLIALHIEQAAIDPQDPEGLADMVLAAAVDAFDTLRAVGVRRMNEVTDGFSDLLAGLRQRADAPQTGVRPIWPAFTTDARPPHRPGDPGRHR